MNDLSKSDNLTNNFSLTPKEIFNQLNRFIIGQEAAKRAVAVAMRNRYRRQQLSANLKSEFMPKNILMQGATGVGKTEIARRLAKISNSPFIKVEATKFTEIGYVGRDVESIIRDLADIAYNMFKKQAMQAFEKQAADTASERILEALLDSDYNFQSYDACKDMLDKGELEDFEISIKLSDKSNLSGKSLDIPGMQGVSMGVVNLGDILGKFSGIEREKTIKTSVKNARQKIISEVCEELLDEDEIIEKTIYNTANEGIVFIDEIDKTCSSSDEKGGKRGEISREGVQRDLLPLVEGTTIQTKYGVIATDHILFIAAGSFYSAKISDLLPELQGRFPIIVKLNSLELKDMVRIIKEPENNLLIQYSELLAVDGVKLKFTEDGITKIAEVAIDLNTRVENIGARRLHTIFEILLDDVSFEAPDKNVGEILIDANYITEKLAKYLKDNITNLNNAII